MKKMKSLTWIAGVALLSVGVMLLWNWLIPAIFGLTSINYWQALGLLVLARILFGGFGGRMMQLPARHDMRDNRFREKWNKMTPEERNEFIRKRRMFMHQHPFGMPDDCGCEPKNDKE